MYRLYKKKVRVVIGKLGSNGRSIQGIRIAFYINMDDTKETNTGIVSLYNLSNETIGLLEKENTSIILSIGYDDEETSILFIGDVVEYKNEYNGVDTITKITLKDGYISLTNSKITLSFSEGSTSKQIINKIISVLNVTTADYSLLPNFVYKQGFSFIGGIGSALDTILARIGYKWTITNNVLVITKPNETNNKTISQFLSLETGLVSQPKRLKDSNIKTKIKENRLMDGWQFECLIIPSIKPNSLIKVEHANINGIFLVKSVQYYGDTHDSTWLCQIKAI